MNQVKSSKNYEWFKYLANNRKISQHHLNSLREQFTAYGNITEISPITVNAHGFILDGQHRRILCEEFGYPVFYTESDAKKEITPAMNSAQKRWSAIDYINFFAAYKPEYEMLRRFMSVNEVTFPVASAVLFTTLNRKFVSDKRLKDGTLEVAPFIQKAQENMDIISEIGEKMGSTMNERYVRGIVRCLSNEEFSLPRFMKKLDLVMRQSPSLPNPRLNAIEDVMRNLEAIYNYMSGEKQHALLFR